MSLTISVPGTPAPTGFDSGEEVCTSNPFSPPADSVIFIFVCANSLASGQTVGSITDTSVGGPLSWNRIPGAISNTFVSGVVVGSAEVWYAPCPSAQSNITATVTMAGANTPGNPPLGFVQPVTFTEADTTQNGAVTPKSSTTNAAITADLITTRDNSWVFSICSVVSSSALQTPGANQTKIINGIDNSELQNTGDGDDYCAWMQNAVTPTSGTTVTMNSTTPSGANYNMVVVEILPASTGGTPFNGSAEGGNATADGGSATYTPPISATTLTLAIG